MTDPTILAQLQAVWSQSVPVVLTKPDKPKLCGQHINPNDWSDEPTLERPGWIRTTCKLCGAFIGYRPNGDSC